MNFSNDRDLLAIDPPVFEDVPFAAQKRLHVTDATINGITLISATGNFVAAGITTGSVVLVNGVTHEVMLRTDANTLEVSLPRTHPSDPAIPGTGGMGLEVIARTFGPQAELVHDSLLRLIGIAPDDDNPVLTEASVLSVELMRRIEALGTLELVYSGAASLVGNNDILLMKADEYRKRFRQACTNATVLLDTDGDGIADERLSLGSVCLSRM